VGNLFGIVVTRMSWPPKSEDYCISHSETFVKMELSWHAHVDTCVLRGHWKQLRFVGS
jgi:hypothetical protein